VLLSIDSNRDTAFALDLESKFELVAMFFKPVSIDWKLFANRMIESCRCSNLVYNENKYSVVKWSVYLESSMYLRRRQWLRQIVVICHIAWFRSGALLSLTSFIIQASKPVVFNLFCKIDPLQALCLKIAPFL